MMHSTLTQIAIKSFPWQVFFTRSEGHHYHTNSSRISGISLKFSGMMHSNIKQIAIKNGHAQPIFARSKELKNIPW